MLENKPKKRNNILFYIMLPIPIIGLLLFFVLGFLAIKNIIGNNKLEKEGHLAIGHYDHVFWSRGYNYINFNYTLNGKKYNWYDYSEGLGIVSEGDKFWILYLPSDPDLSKLLRDKFGKVVMYKDSSEVKTLRYPIKYIH